MTQCFSRRSFLAQAGIGAMGLAGLASLAGCAPQSQGENGAAASNVSLSATDVNWDKQADVVVVGVGMMGSVATIDAVQAGLSVIACETRGQLGGDATICDGVLIGAHSRQDKEKGYDVTFDQVEAETGSYMFDAIDHERAQWVFERSGDAIDWIEEQGCEFDNPEDGVNLEYSELPIYHVLKGGSIGFAPVWENVETSGAEVLTDTRVIQLVEDETGRIVGVVAEDGTTIGASKGVVLATGSYGGNVELLEMFDARQKGLGTFSLEGHNGDGLLMAMAVGATPVRTGYEGFLEFSPYGFPYLALYEGCIMVGSDGKRFVNEDAPTFNDLGFAMNRVCREQGTEFVTVVASDSPSLLEAREAGYEMVVSDSLADIAQAFGVDEAALAEEVEQYNAMVAAGKDEAFGKDPAYMAKIVAPYCGMNLKSSVMFSSGGLKVNENCQVLRMTPSGSEVIEGLYAGGRMLPYDYHIGFANTDAISCGRAAVAHIANA